MSNEKEPLLVVKDLKKYFHTKSGELKAVDGVSFSINRGETLGLVGESGCGKSTVGRAIIRLHEPTSGQVLMNGKNILEYKSKEEMKHLRQSMQIVFQDPYSSLNPRMNTFDLIADPARVNHLFSSEKELEDAVYDMMDTVGLTNRFAGAFPHEMDGGSRQRIGIARALILKPEFIVMDEPVSALDVSVQAQVLNLMDELQKEFKLTYLFISHDLSVVRHISDWVAVMYLGQIVEMSRYDVLFDNPMHPYTKALLSAIPIPKYGLQRERIYLKGDVPSPLNPPAGCRFAGRVPWIPKEAHEEHPELREVEPDHWVRCTCYQYKS
ncbi:ATP-binding cassette domain-containing protein [Atopobacter sp. AH10]|uniref:ABC transporter ATP-binding protein n=1 Tax=Atopobacter sp. AH10 TaxID=2315861 RepID=UPI000EF19ED2|nr:oligopeptide/dipeptide ABC transporter ATP-binding protein [Atopobacter sp. AH10]RLK64169.1 ATP-binding cassette domain-containing protein [Atopobacter sp. AH10]